MSSTKGRWIPITAVVITGIVIVISVWLMFFASPDNDRKMAAGEPAGKLSTRPGSKGGPSILSRPEKREEIRYIITIMAKEPQMAFAGLMSMIGEGLAHPKTAPLKEGNANQLLVPRNSYSKFIGRLKSMGKLKVERERFETDLPSSAPVPFTVEIHRLP